MEQVTPADESTGTNPRQGKVVRLYLSNDTSSRAAGTARLAEAWIEQSDLQIVRTSSRGAFFLEPMVERDMPEGRMAWFNVTSSDLPRIRAGEGGVYVRDISFLNRQSRFTYENFGITEPLAPGCLPGPRWIPGVARRP